MRGTLEVGSSDQARYLLQFFEREFLCRLVSSPSFEFANLCRLEESIEARGSYSSAKEMDAGPP